MKKLFVAALASAAMLVTTADFALAAGKNNQTQTTRVNANSNSNSNSKSNSQSSATGGSAESRSNASLNYNNRERRQAPGIGVPSVAAGGISCAMGGSGGVSLPGVGIAFSAMTERNDCNTRENARVAHSYFGGEAARTVACKIKDLRDLPQCQRYVGNNGGAVVNNRRAGRQQVASVDRSGPPTIAEWMASR